jgi:hypothetical protein
MSEQPEVDRPHDRRYKVFAVVFGVVVLTFAAISIAVVIMTL